MYKIIRNILLFFFVFDISFTFMPLSTAKISTLAFSLAYVLKLSLKSNKKITISEFMFYALSFVILIYNLILLITLPSSDGTTFFRVLYFLIYSVLMSTIIPSFYKNRMDFFESVGTITAVQGVFVIISWVSSSFRQIINSFVINTGNISFLSEKRPPGLMSSAGAGSSIILAIGTVLLFYLITKGNKNRSYLNIIKFVISFAATFIVGRTGFLVVIALIGVIISESVIKQPTKLKKLIIIIPTIAVILIIMMNVLSAYLPTQLTMKFDWVFNEFQNGILSSYTVEVLRNMTIKPIALDTIIGTSRIRLPGGNHDAGYIQNYHSMGLIASALFYLSVIFYIIILYRKNKNYEFKKNNKLFIYMLIVIMFIIEIKEPFMFYYFYPWVIFSILKVKN